jgi:hypothetical protein
MADEDIFVTMSADNEHAKSSLRELRVLTGLHKGAALTLSSGLVTIGSDAECSIVLLDEGVMPVHLSLQWISDKGWVQTDFPDAPLTEPLRAGPVWLSVVAPNSPWIDSALLQIGHSDQSALAPTVSPAAPNVRHAQSIRPWYVMRRWALLGVCISCVLLLVITGTDVGMGSASGSSAFPPPVHTNTEAQVPAQTISNLPAGPLLEPPDKDVIAVVGGKTGFVLMRNGQRVYVGEAFGQFVLVDVQNAHPTWRSNLSSSIEE